MKSLYNARVRRVMDKLSCIHSYSRTSMVYSIQQGQTGDEFELVKLLELVFNGWPRFDLKYSSIEHWRWKYQENPHRKHYISTCVSDEKIIGCFHGFPKKVKIYDVTYLTQFGADAGVHPDFRRKGISKKLRNKRNEIAWNEGIRFFLGITSNPILVATAAKVGKPFPHQPVRLSRIQDIDLHLKKRKIDNAQLMKLGYVFLRIINRFKQFRLNKKSYNFDIKEIHEFDEGINEFWKSVKDHHDFIIERKKDYLNWRYGDKRGGDYTIKICEKDNVILGFCVLRINYYEEDYPVGYIVDLLTLPGHMDVARGLVEDSLRYFDGREVNVVYFQVLGKHRYQDMMADYGFLKDFHSPLLRIQHISFNEVMEKPLGELSSVDVDRVHFVYGDTDWI